MHRDMSVKANRTDGLENVLPGDAESRVYDSLADCIERGFSLYSDIERADRERR